MPSWPRIIPPELLDLYIADDHSTDGTSALIARYAEQTRGTIASTVVENATLDNRAELPAVHGVTVPPAAGSLRGKANAIHAAVESCDHALLIVTDADCAPPPQWVRRHVAYFSDDAVGMVCGHTHVDARSLFEAMQALDWAYLLTTCSVFVEMGRPVTAMGNNMAFRRTAYEAVGGYPALPFSVTEDYVLFRTVAEDSGFEVRYPFDSGLRTYTLPLNRISDVYQQRRRWARGGMQAPPWVYGLYTVVHLAHLLLLVAIFVAPPAALIALVTKAGADFALLWVALGKSGRRRLLRAFGLFELYLATYLTALPTMLLLFPRINWKDRKL